MGLWEAVGLVALVVAVMALPPVFQMFWGRPQISVEYTRDNSAGHLFCDIYNKPVSNRFLVWLRVRRETASITVGVHIQNETTKEIIIRVAIPLVLIRERLENLSNVDLPPGHTPLSIRVVQIDGRGAGVHDSNGQWIHLPAAIYRMEMTVMAGEKNLEMQHNFVVTAEPSHTYWADG
jgi:hypothetical protein